MNKRELLSMSDTKLDSTVRIAGTNYDRRRTVTNSMIRKMNQMFEAGKSISTIAKHFGVSTYIVKYNTNKEFATSENKRRVENYKKNPTKTNLTKKRNDIAERILYKRELVQNGKKLVINN